jgi:hypothetical protein
MTLKKEKEVEVPISQAGGLGGATNETKAPNVPPPNAKHPAKAPPLSPDYKRLKELDAQLDKGQGNVAKAQEKYQEVLRKFAKLCHDLWKAEKAQGSRKEKGFRRALKQAGIKVGRAYRAMKKFFPEDFPASQLRSQRTKSTQPFLAQDGEPLADGTVLVSAALPMTADEKQQLLQDANIVGLAKATSIMIEALHQHVESLRANGALNRNLAFLDDEGLDRVDKPEPSEQRHDLSDLLQRARKHKAAVATDATQDSGKPTGEADEPSAEPIAVEQVSPVTSIDQNATASAAGVGI